MATEQISRDFRSHSHCFVCNTLLLSSQKYPIVWQGLLALKNDTAAVQLHFVSGNNVLAHRSLPAPEGGPPLRIAQRMRLEASQLEGVARRMMVRPGVGPGGSWGIPVLRAGLVSPAVGLNSAPRNLGFCHVGFQGMVLAPKLQESRECLDTTLRDPQGGIVGNLCMAWSLAWSWTQSSLWIPSSPGDPYDSILGSRH